MTHSINYADVDISSGSECSVILNRDTGEYTFEGPVYGTWHDIAGHVGASEELFQGGNVSRIADAIQIDVKGDGGQQQHQHQQQKLPSTAAQDYEMRSKAYNFARPEDVRSCNSGRRGQEYCFVNPGSLCYSQRSTESELKPYLRPRVKKTKTWIQRNILGSAIASQFWTIMLVYGACVMVTQLIVYSVIPASIFPVDSGVIDLLLTVFMFLLGGYYSVHIGNNISLFKSNNKDVMGNIADTAMNLTAAIDDHAGSQRLWRFRYDSTRNKVTAKIGSVWCELTDINSILRALPYAIKHEYRERNKNLDVRKLPMNPDLIEELLTGMDNRVPALDMLRRMYTARVSRLLEAGVIAKPTFGNLMGKSDGFGSYIGEIEFLLTKRATPPVLDNLMLIALISYCLWSPLALYNYWYTVVHPAAYYVVLFVVPAFFLGLYGALNEIGNPFEDPEKSNFNFFDIGAVANETAASVDGLFQLAKTELVAVAINPKIRRLTAAAAAATPSSGTDAAAYAAAVNAAAAAAKS